MRASRVFLAALPLALAACGNISNEDLQFAAVLPDDTVQFKAPDEDGQALTSDDTATTESPLFSRTDVKRGAIAREHAKLLNRFVKDTAARLREITAFPPTTREDGKRTWGPFAMKNKRFGKLVMTRDATVSCGTFDAQVPGFAWEFSTTDKKTGAFSVLLSGKVRGESFLESCGEIHFDVAEWKKNGGLTESDDPARADVTWSRAGDAYLVTATVQPVLNEKGRLLPGVRSDFEARADGSFRFEFTREEHQFGTNTVATKYQWKAHGKPARIDVTITGGTTPVVSGDPVVTACWSAEGSLTRYTNPFDRRQDIAGECAF